jgi:thiosulfate reductase cytochrome b subunit
MANEERVGHAVWVRLSHWVLAASALTLACSGFVILMAHPRLYWGSVGNDLTPALVELPISRNYKHNGYDKPVPIAGDGRQASLIRTYDIFNQNGWARSLHFLAAWWFVLPGALYLAAGTAGHFRAHIWPRRGELTAGGLARELRDHLRPHVPPASGGPDYGLLQKCAYVAVIFVLSPLMVLTGFAMSPTIAAGVPFLQRMFGGFQSARTIHFAAFAALLLFVAVHVVEVARSGFRRQLRGMTLGN